MNEFRRISSIINESNIDFGSIDSIQQNLEKTAKAAGVKNCVIGPLGKLWVVHIFASPNSNGKDRFKSIGDMTIKSVINIAVGSDPKYSNTEIAGIFFDEQSAKKFYDALDIRKEK